jgi:hypothetical protein
MVVRLQAVDAGIVVELEGLDSERRLFRGTKNHAGFEIDQDVRRRVAVSAISRVGQKLA